jgi:hypothetical protein
MSGVGLRLSSGRIDVCSDAILKGDAIIFHIVNMLGSLNTLAPILTREIPLGMGYYSWRSAEYGR